MAVNRPASISIKSLSAAVEKAVKNQAAVTPGLHIGPLIIGKVARPQDFAQAEKLAAEITNQVTSPGGPLAAIKTPPEPAVLVRGGVIICGFIAPEVELVEQ